MQVYDAATLQVYHAVTLQVYDAVKTQVHDAVMLQVYVVGHKTSSQKTMQKQYLESVNDSPPLFKFDSDAKLVHFLNQNADVVAADLAEHFVNHRHRGLGADRRTWLWSC